MVKKVITYAVVAIMLLTTFSCATHKFGLDINKMGGKDGYGFLFKNILDSYTIIYGRNPASVQDLIVHIERFCNDEIDKLVFAGFSDYFRKNAGNLIFESGFDSALGDSTIAIYYKYPRRANLIVKTPVESPCVSMHRAQYIFFDKQGVHFFSDSLAKELRSRVVEVGKANAEFLKKDTSNRYVWAIFDYTLGGDLLDVCSRRIVNYDDSPYSTNLHNLLKDFAIANNLSRIRALTFTD